MKHIPDVIHLNTGLDLEEAKQTDFKDLHQVTWTEEKVFDGDVKYVSANAIEEIVASGMSDKLKLRELIRLIT